MKYISVAEAAKRMGVSERTVRGYCADGKIPDAFLTGKTWNIPETAQKPARANKKVSKPETLLDILRMEKDILYRMEEAGYCRRYNLYR